jgi:hypothetical protein
MQEILVPNNKRRACQAFAHQPRQKGLCPEMSINPQVTDSAIE